MVKEKCPKCKKSIDAIADICPYCGELIFFDVIEASDLEEAKKDNKDIVKNEEELEESKKGKKRWFFNLFKKIKIPQKIKKLLKKIKIPQKIKILYGKIKEKLLFLYEKLKESRIYPYITYQNVLCAIALIMTISMVATGIKIALYTDKTSTVSKVNKNTTYQEVEKMQKEEKVERGLDLQRGLIILTYKEQDFAGIKCTVKYEVFPKSDKIERIVVLFPYKRANISKMKKYLEVNYGYGKKDEEGKLTFINDEYRYVFTNGVYNKGKSGSELEEEQVEIASVMDIKK